MHERVLAESIRELERVRELRVNKPLLYSKRDENKAVAAVGHDKFMLEAARIGKREIVHEHARRRVVGRLVKDGGSAALMDGAL
jgi:hypothetical protein